MVVDYVSDLFSLDVNALVMDRVGFWAIDWINNRQEKMLDSIGFNQDPGYTEYGDLALDYVLRKAIASDCYILKGNFSDNFRFDGKLGPANHLLVYSNGHWVTPQNLMNFDFIIIVIEKSRISISDLNSFLRHWRAGGSNRLKILQLGFESDTNLENFGGELGMEVLEGGYYSIQRDDGVTAVIKFGIRSFIMSVVPQEEII
ncbi:hypothetical protein B9Z55_015182 [Caenorhabditis nigoni]|nr:hypothetical protein B9Z55_015182 [Caenorhabditis nigoni]